jgi:Glutathione S-transferase, N-terminal domain
MSKMTTVPKASRMTAAALFPGDALWDASWHMGAGEENIRRRMNPPYTPQLQFYSSWFCPFAQRTWITLEESGVNYKWNEVRSVSSLSDVLLVLILWAKLIC